MRKCKEQLRHCRSSGVAGEEEGKRLLYLGVGHLDCTGGGLVHAPGYVEEAAVAEGVFS